MTCSNCGTKAALKTCQTLSRTLSKNLSNLHPLSDFRPIPRPVSETHKVWQRESTNGMCREVHLITASARDRKNMEKNEIVLFAKPGALAKAYHSSLSIVKLGLLDTWIVGAHSEVIRTHVSWSRSRHQRSNEQTPRQDWLRVVFLLYVSQSGKSSESPPKK